MEVFRDFVTHTHRDKQGEGTEVYAVYQQRLFIDKASYECMQKADEPAFPLICMWSLDNHYSSFMDTRQSFCV